MSPAPIDGSQPWSEEPRNNLILTYDALAHFGQRYFVRASAMSFSVGLPCLQSTG